MILDLALSPDYGIKSTNKNNKKSKRHGVHLVLANYSRACSLPWAVVAPLHCLSIEENQCSFPKHEGNGNWEELWEGK